MNWFLYTDGGAAPSNPGPAAWGAVIITPDKVISHHKGFIGRATASKVANFQGLANGVVNDWKLRFTFPFYEGKCKWKNQACRS